jgi:hypothetical protein
MKFITERALISDVKYAKKFLNATQHTVIDYLHFNHNIEIYNNKKQYNVTKEIQNHNHEALSLLAHSRLRIRSYVKHELGIKDNENQVNSLFILQK